MGKAVIRISAEALIRMLAMSIPLPRFRPPVDSKVIRVVEESGTIHIAIESEVLPESEVGAGWPVLFEIRE